MPLRNKRTALLLSVFARKINRFTFKYNIINGNQILKSDPGLMN